MMKMFAHSLMAIFSFFFAATNVFGEVVLFDDFEYTVTNNPGDAAANLAAFQAAGWSGGKATNLVSNRGANGNFYTVDVSDVPGNNGVAPSPTSSKVLAINPLGDTGGHQTDFYLSFGSGTTDAIPADVWFQFWVYSAYDGTHPSTYDVGKFFYVCNDDYPCHSHRWMTTFGPVAQQATPFNLGTGDGYSRSTSFGEFTYQLAASAGVSTMSYAPQPDANAYSQTTWNEWVTPNRWTLVKMHFDTSTSNGTWEMWMRPYGSAWIKVAEWIGGTTPGFEWTYSSPGGHRFLRLITTVGTVNGPNYDSWMYMDDFIIATAEEDLPAYPDAVGALAPPLPPLVEQD